MILRLTALVLLLTSPAQAEVVSVAVEAREPVLGGHTFGHAGAYEKLRGRIHLELDPAHPANARIVDLARAPRNARGRVEARADFMAVQPREPGRRRGVALLEVPNRGGKAALGYFNQGRFSADPRTPEDFGDGLLMRLGLTLVWVGWQPDVPPRPDRLRLSAPVASQDGSPIEGLVRSDWVVEAPIRTLPLGHRGHVAYPVSDPAHPDNVLTVRDGRDAPRRLIPRAAWRFARETAEGGVVDDRSHLFLAVGFEPGRIYELVYAARDPVVVGMGLAAVRDTIAYAKHHPDAVFPARLGVAFGVSQTGRFLRHLLWDGLNIDESGRRAFDGMLVHTAGAGRGSFNHRFAQPSRDAHRFSAFFYPTDVFPFAMRAQRHPETGLEDGLLARLGPAHVPRLFLINTGYEYWGRAASLIHTSIDGRADLEPVVTERRYHLASGQHFVGEFPPAASARGPGTSAYRGQPLDFLPMLRALLVRLVDWVADGREPPPSAYPRIADGTLVPIDRLRFPAIPGVARPSVVHRAHRLDFGSRWREGVITREPPGVGAPFPALVPQVDELGNEVAGVRGVELLAPLATYSPWNVRTGLPGPPGELMDFVGTYVPLPRTEAARTATGDARPSVAARWASRADYLAAARHAAESLVARGFLLEEDVTRVVDRAAAHWDWLAPRP